MRPTDTVLICRDCEAPFTFSDDERGTFAALGHVHPPSRCSACREARKTRQNMITKFRARQVPLARPHLAGSRPRAAVVGPSAGPWSILELIRSSY